MATEQKKIACETLTRIAPGDYETDDGQYRIVRLEAVSPPAWDLIEAPFTRNEETIYSGCASLRDARLFLKDIRNGN